MCGVGKSTMGWVVRQFVKALLKHMDRFICCPAREVASQQVKQGFEAQRGFPNFIGAIDNTHIELELPQSEWHTAWREDELSIEKRRTPSRESTAIDPGLIWWFMPNRSGIFL